MPPYPKNFLTKVIARIDYQPILILDEERPSKFQEVIRDEFPRLEEIRGLGIGIRKGTSSPISVEKLPIVWKLMDKDKTNVVDLGSKYFSLETTKYIRFSDFLDRLTRVYNPFVENYKPGIITRIGLRYINEIKFPGDPFDWEGLLNERLFSTFHAFPDKRQTITRSMHQLHFKGDDHTIIFQFGIFNSEFPNTIAQKEFILDYDCISEEEHEPQDVLPKFARFNSVIWDLFEKSIEEDLRVVMRDGGEQ